VETPLKKPSDLGWSQTGTNKTIPRRSSSIQHIIELKPPFPIVQSSDRFFITFNLKFKTQELTKFKKSKRFDETHNLIALKMSEQSD